MDKRSVLVGVGIGVASTLAIITLVKVLMPLLIVAAVVGGVFLLLRRGNGKPST